MIAIIEFFRIVAFCAIFLHHLSYKGSLGVIAVSAFFVITGFVSANSLIKFKTINIGMLSEYYLSRAIRLYPVHFLTFIISLPVVAVKSSPFDTIANLLLLHNWYPSGIQIFSHNSVSWFISDIVFFSILTPFILNFLTHNKIHKSVTKLLLIKLILFGTAVFITLEFRGVLKAYSFGWWFIYASPYFRLVDYMLGLMAGIIFINLKQIMIPNIKNKKVIFTILELLSLILFISIYKMPYFKYQSIVMSIYYTPAIIIIVTIFSFQQGIVSSALNIKLFTNIGKLTFSAFLTHQVVFRYAQKIIPSIYNIPSGQNNICVQFVLFLFVMIISAVIYRYYELPIKRLFNKHYVSRSNL